MKDKSKVVSNNAPGEESREKQHREAMEMVRCNIGCAAMVDRGEIPLEWKRHPTIADPFYSKVENGGNCELRGDDPAADDVDRMARLGISSSVDKDRYAKGWCVSSRGMVDVSSLVDLIEEGSQELAVSMSNVSLKELKDKRVKSESNLWDAANACQNNVHITRPAHDGWGIKKIALVFCDDFLQTVYEMPFWHLRPNIRLAVQPVLDTLHIQQDRIVRLLLAALPPGGTIPAHHDTGSWVQHTHRVHVPVLVEDPSKVLFRCGPTLDSMDRISCLPGHVFEMNNQAKHAVSNCHPTHHRVHLILDYVDASFHISKRVQLSPGETLLQTRRSIDRQADFGSRPAPSFMILGAQKSGTTSLYDYINQHPLVVRARRRETHCLDWRWDPSLSSTSSRQKRALQFFFTDELKRHPSCMTGESTPSYLLDSKRCIPRLKQVFPWPIQFIVILRDPVKRLKSHVAMVTSLDGTPEQIQHRGTEWINMTLSQIVQSDIENMKQDGLIPHWDTHTHTVDQSVFDAFAGSKQEDLAFQRYLEKRVPLMTGSHSPVSRGLYELQLRQWFQAFDKSHFLVLKLEDMAATPTDTTDNDTTKTSGVQITMEKVFRHLDLPPYTVVDESPKNTRSYDALDSQTKTILQRFYAPYNQRLKTLLGPGNNDEWIHPWNY